MLAGDIEILQFEQWAYNEARLKDVLSDEDYLELISIGYGNKEAMFEVKNILERNSDKAEYEKWRLLHMLRKVLAMDPSTPDILLEFYDLYCHGYNFMDNLGVGFGLKIVYPPSNYSANTFEELSEQEQKDLINSFYPSIEPEIDKVIDWIETRTLVLSGEKDEMNYYRYTDHRTHQQKRATSYIRQDNTSGQKSISITQLIVISILGGLAVFVEFRNIRDWDLLMFGSLLHYIPVSILLLLSINYLVRNIQRYQRVKKKGILIPGTIGLLFLLLVFGHMIVLSQMEKAPNLFTAHNGDIGSDGGFLLEFKSNNRIKGHRIDKFGETFYWGSYTMKNDTVDLNINLDFPMGRHAIIQDQTLVFLDDTVTFSISKY